MSMYDKIAQGLTNAYTPKAKERQKAKVELQFNQSEQGFTKAMSSKDAKEIEKIVNALIQKKDAIYNKIFSTGGSDEDIKEYKEVMNQLEQLQYHVESLHDKGDI